MATPEDDRPGPRRPAKPGVRGRGGSKGSGSSTGRSPRPGARGAGPESGRAGGSWGRPASGGAASGRPGAGGGAGGRGRPPAGDRGRAAAGGTDGWGRPQSGRAGAPADRARAGAGRPGKADAGNRSRTGTGAAGGARGGFRGREVDAGGGRPRTGTAGAGSRGRPSAAGGGSRGRPGAAGSGRSSTGARTGGGPAFGGRGAGAGRSDDRRRGLESGRAGAGGAGRGGFRGRPAVDGRAGAPARRPGAAAARGTDSFQPRGSRSAREPTARSFRAGPRSGGDRVGRGGSGRDEGFPGRRPRRDDATPRPDDRAPRTWGALARKSLRELEPDAQPGEARRAWRDAVARARGDDEAPWQPEVWVEDDAPVPATAPRRSPRAGRAGAPPSGGAAVAPAAGEAGETTGRRPRRRLPQAVRAEVAKQVPATKAPRYQERLAEAAKAYERDRYRDAIRILKPLAEAIPGASAVRELYGLALYRLGRWNEAIRELEAFRALEPAAYDQHPTLADCYRAKKRWREVGRLWDELREASPSAELVAEGRIVMAGALADQGRLDEAIALLDKARTDTKRPRPHHLRLWYATADLYERAGEIPRARDLFARVADADPELYDVVERLAGIR